MIDIVTSRQQRAHCCTCVSAQIPDQVSRPIVGRKMVRGMLISALSISFLVTGVTVTLAQSSGISRSKPAPKAEAAMGVPRPPSAPALRDVTGTVPLPSPELLERQSEPDCEIPPSDRLLGPIPEMTRLIYERQCYKNAEALVRSKLQLLQDTIGSTIKGLNDAPRPVAATPPPPPRSKPPLPKMIWARIDGRRGPEVAQQTEVDFATCKELAGDLAAQLQQADTFNLNLRACMGQHGYQVPAQ